MSEANPGPRRSTTVDRAGALLHLLAEHPEGLGITVLTRHLHTQRAPLYRILDALIQHRLVRRDEHKRYLLGVGTLQLARAYAAQYPAGVEQMLADLAHEADMTSSLIAAEGDVFTTVSAIMPKSNSEYVFTPPGFRHPDRPLSIRTAVAATRPAAADDSEDVIEARRLGYAVGRGRAVHSRYGMAAVIPGTTESAAPLVLALVSLREFDHESLAEPLLRTAESIAHTLR